MLKRKKERKRVGFCAPISTRHFKFLASDAERNHLIWGPRVLRYS